MDFGNALLLVSTVFLIVELAARLVPKMGAQAKVVVAVVAGQAATQLVAHSDWGAKQVISGLALNAMNVGSLILVGLALTGLAVVGKQTLSALSNIGQNQ